MKEMDLLRAIGGVREEYIEDAWVQKTPRSGRKWLTMAACLAVLVALSVTALALTDAGELLRRHIYGEVQFKGFSTQNPAPGYIESHYELELRIDTVPEAEITGEVLTDALATIRWQRQNYKPWDSWAPGHAIKQFDTEAEAVKYVGYGPLKLPRLDWMPEYVHVNALEAMEADHLSQIGIECFYKRDGINVQTFATVYTEYYGREPELQGIVPGRVEFSQDRYVTEGGTPCFLLGIGENEDSYLAHTAYLVVDQVLYRFNVACQPEQEEAALALLYQMLEQY